jgi:hypothetical protein
MNKRILICIFSVIMLFGALFTPQTKYKDNISTIKPFTAGQTDPYETIETAVYTKDENGEDKRVFYLDEVGILVTEDGKPVVNSNDENTLIATYDAATQNYIDGANRALNIFLDSHLEKHYLSSGGEYTTAITLDREVFLINYKGKLIYSFREKRKKDWYEYVPIVNIFTSLRDDYLWFDMNGRELVTKEIAEYKNAWLAKTGKVLIAIETLGISEYALSSVTFKDIRERTTLAELTNLMTHATQHPWSALLDENNMPVVTADGIVIRINPRTNQLTDTFGWALFNSHTGMPIIFYNNDVITFNVKKSVVQQQIENAVLLEAVTVKGLLDTGTEFYMDSVTTQYGTFDCPVFYDKNNGKWTFITGGEVEGITNGIKLWTESPANGQSFSEWWDSLGVDNMFDGMSDTVKNFMRILGIVAVVVVVLLLLPIISPIIKIISLPFVMFADSIKNITKKKKGGRRYD